MKYDYLIAYIARKAGKKCLVIDRRPQLGGNVYCEDIDGIHVHKYGAHIFHTSNKEIWNFVNSLVEFNRYTNSPVANYKGKLYNLPFNMNTFYQMWGVTTPDEAQAKIDEQRREALEQFKTNNPQFIIDGKYEPQNLEEQALLLVGKDIYERLIKCYTEKQWGRNCTDLPAFIIKRLPVRLVFDNNYFNDTCQGIPVGGYNVLVNKLLEGVETKINTDFFADRKGFESLASKIVYTGQLDEYFDYKLGHLNFRTVRFETEEMETPNYQGNAVVNFTARDVPYTRVIEHKHFEMFGQAVYDNPKTVVSREYSTEWKPGMEPYYPVNDEKNNRLADEYRSLAAKEENVIFGGRLAEYKYYDMAPVIESAIRAFHKAEDK